MLADQTDVLTVQQCHCGQDEHALVIKQIGCKLLAEILFIIDVHCPHLPEQKFT
ncbi:hypothetical protein D3C80_1936420 [compost metagenome]